MFFLSWELDRGWHVVQLNFQTLPACLTSETSTSFLLFARIVALPGDQVPGLDGGEGAARLEEETASVALDAATPSAAAHGPRRRGRGSSEPRQVRAFTSFHFPPFPLFKYLVVHRPACLRFLNGHSTFCFALVFLLQYRAGTTACVDQGIVCLVKRFLFSATADVAAVAAAAAGLLCFAIFRSPGASRPPWQQGGLAPESQRRDSWIAS